MQKVLVVDDDAHIRDVVCFALRREGFDVLEASTGRAAVEKFESEQPDLIVLDVLMPEGDGIAVCKQIRQSSIAPIIFLSSNSADISPLKAAHYMKKNPTQSIQSNPFWKSKHPDIEKLVADNFNDKTPSQCSICHLDAKSGRFESSHITF